MQVRNLEGFYTDTERFDTGSGFMVAAGIPAPGALKAGEPIPPDIGALNFYRQVWGSDYDGDIGF